MASVVRLAWSAVAFSMGNQIAEHRASVRRTIAPVAAGNNLRKTAGQRWGNRDPLQNMTVEPKVHVRWEQRWTSGGNCARRSQRKDLPKPASLQRRLFKNLMVVEHPLDWRKLRRSK